ncbi:PPOX class F420-dependent oxidoreductase [Pseudonocardia sp. DSM 110487]|uniref:PPOX class F420-dependent oxidoreductase n=1 Tax=Pseudonocardia sp. DSM 110487 TaxID=2865833 RepID=UPI001C69A9E8|nr:PPOX class F420-dependent oxidoreductase [Pseudonocardia sp. DSM 110487]QYN36004.1 PPOX class F420-dependent oxidoreductase [Pseudonocardia sp. DSM 110487]
MSIFTTAEIEYLRSQPLARLATVGADGRPQVKPVGIFLDPDTDELVVGGVVGSGMGTSKKFRDVAATGVAALVVDDLASVDPWTPRGVEVRGLAEARLAGGAEVGRRLGAPFDFDPEWILVRPTRIVSWGIDGSSFQMSARDAVKAG